MLIKQYKREFSNETFWNTSYARSFSLTNHNQAEGGTYDINICHNINITTQYQLYFMVLFINSRCLNMTSFCHFS